MNTDNKMQNMILIDDSEIGWYSMKDGFDLNSSITPDGLHVYVNEDWKDECDAIYDCGYVDVEF